MDLEDVNPTPKLPPGPPNTLSTSVSELAPLSPADLEPIEVLDDGSDEAANSFEYPQTHDLNLEALPGKEALDLLGKRHDEALAANDKLISKLNSERLKTSQLENQLSLGKSYLFYFSFL